MPHQHRLLLLVVTLLALLAPQTHGAPPDIAGLEDRFVQLTEQIRPLVVNIDTEGVVLLLDGEAKGPSESPSKEVRPGQGSGFIYDKQGHIVTNSHVVENASRITVRMSNGKEYDAKTVGRDPETDLAVIKIQPDADFAAATLGDSDTLKPGQFVVACGSARGYEGSFSFGHVSALRRNAMNLPNLRFENFIQTDAPINQGNSGGPLCNIDGEVIGINVAIIGGANSLGFAIPASTARRIVPLLISQGKITRCFFGVSLGDAKPFAEALAMPDKKGVFVKTVEPGDPADTAGLKPYDVIRKLDGKELEGLFAFRDEVTDVAPGQTLHVEVWRDDHLIEMDMKAGEHIVNAFEPTPSKETLGLKVDAITPEIAASFALPNGTTGVLVSQVEPVGAAATAGLAQGDIIQEVGRKRVNNAEEFANRMKECATPGKSVFIAYIRAGRPNITVIKMPES